MCIFRAWKLTGISCSHAICALYHSKIDPLSMISNWYHKSKYLETYEHPLLPVPGPRFQKFSQYEPIEPPPVPKLSGRPRKIRLMGSNEPRPTTGSDGKLTKKGMIQSCGICHKHGHNRKSCQKKGHQV